MSKWKKLYCIYGKENMIPFTTVNQRGFTKKPKCWLSTDPHDDFKHLECQFPGCWLGSDLKIFVYLYWSFRNHTPKTLGEYVSCNYASVKTHLLSWHSTEVSYKQNKLIKYSFPPKTLFLSLCTLSACNFSFNNHSRRKWRI